VYRVRVAVLGNIIRDLDEPPLRLIDDLIKAEETLEILKIKERKARLNGGLRV
jgi:hypothetical protein